MPTSNDQVLLQTLLEQTRKEVAPELAASEYFQLYVLEQLLKDRGLSYSELQSGIVDGGGDGGIDALYTLVNGVLVTSTDDAIAAVPGSIIELIIVQCKYTGGFSETAIDRLVASISDLLDLSTPLNSLGEVYNSDLLNAVEAFRNAFIGTASKFPSLRVQFFYATRGIAVDPKVERKARRLKELVSSLFSAAECDFIFLTAADILALARRQQPATLELKLAENPISTKGAGFVGLVKLEDYFDFLTDSQGHLLRVLFESNVRDYEGSRGINQAIQETLVAAHDESDDDFWWLNNGITVVASRATLVSKRLTN